MRNQQLLQLFIQYVRTWSLVGVAELNNNLPIKPGIKLRSRRPPVYPNQKLLSTKLRSESILLEPVTGKVCGEVVRYWGALCRCFGSISMEVLRRTIAGAERNPRSYQEILDHEEAKAPP
jgi:hypothetical protein